MSVAMLRETGTATGLPLPASPVAIDGLFGWFSPGFSRRGVVLCGSLGYEQLSAHRPWRSLAESIAATGCATLRFDYPGQGDSSDEGAESLEGLIAAIRRAVRFLREEAASEEIVLVGLRFGGTLAAMVARECGADRLALIAPFPSGRAYAREMKMQARSVGTLADGTPLPEEAGILSVGGFHLGPEFLAELSGVDIAKLKAPPAPRILVAGADAGNLAGRYAALGAEISSVPLAGLAALVSNPLFARAPEEAFAAVAAFAAEGATLRFDSLTPALPAPRIAGPSWSEETVRFGAGLFGTLCAPLAPARGPTVLFVNAGMNLRSGWGRQTTEHARRLASNGHRSLRIDLGGLGDSAERAEGGLPLFKLEALDDVCAALDLLEGAAPGPVVIVGACSGAHLGFQALCRDPRLSGALITNPYCFDWNPQDDVATVVGSLVRNTSTYASLLGKRSSWNRLLRGEIHVGVIATRLAKAALDRLGQRLSRMLRPSPPGGTVARRIAEIRRRGAKLRLVYSAGDRGLSNLHLQLGRSHARIVKRLGEPVTIIENADHDLSTRAAQARFAALLDDFVTRFDA